jgi:hypothetical protein
LQCGWNENFSGVGSPTPGGKLKGRLSFNLPWPVTAQTRYKLAAERLKIRVRVRLPVLTLVAVSRCGAFIFSLAAIP